MTVVVVAAAQLPACGDDRDKNYAVAEAAVCDAAASGANVVVLPELATTPYFAGEPVGAYQDWAETVPGPQSDRMVELSAELEITIVLPLFEKDADAATFHNSAVVVSHGRIVPSVDRTGTARTVARKLHLPVADTPAPGFDEAAHFTAGGWLGVHSVGDYRIGVLVCYDRRFPEPWRELRSLGADLVVVPVAGSGGDTVEFFHAELRTHARENGVFAVAANKVGVEQVGGHPIDNFGESCVVGPDGEIVARRPRDAGPGLLLAELNLGSLSDTRKALRYFEHRRTDLFPSAKEIL